MGKTYRYNPDGASDGFDWGEAKSAASAEVRKRRGRKKHSDPVMQPDGSMDLSWAVERMQEHVSFVVESLVKYQLIEEGERDEYTAVFNAVVCDAGVKYDPERKGKESGKTASPVHFMTMMVDAKLANVMDYLAYRRWTLKFQVITDDRDTAKNNDAFLWSGDKKLSDGRKWMKLVELKMDVETLFRMLTQEERMTLAMRIEGYTDVEIAEALALAFHRPCDRHRVQKVHVVHIQEKARKCGFFPPWEDGKKKE